MIKLLIASLLALAPTALAAAPIVINFKADGIIGWVGITYPPAAPHAVAPLTGGQVTVDSVPYDVAGQWESDSEAAQGFGHTIITAVMRELRFTLWMPGTDPTGWRLDNHPSGLAASLSYDAGAGRVTPENLRVSYSVPEPTLALLFGVGTAAIAFRRTSRRGRRPPLLDIARGGAIGRSAKHKFLFGAPGG